MIKLLIPVLLILTSFAYGQSVSVLSNSPNPTTFGNDNNGTTITGITVGMHWNTSVNGNVTGVKYFQISGMGGTKTGKLYQAGNTTALGTVTFGAPSGVGWQTASFSSSIPVTASTDYIIAVNYSDGNFPQYLGLFNTAVTNGVLTAPATTSISPGNDCYSYNAGTVTYPSQSGNGTNYGVDVVFSAGGNQSPTVSAGPDQAFNLPTTSVNLVGTATDPDGTVSSVAWTQVSGTSGTITTPTATTTTVTGLTTAGIRVFRLTATDNLGATNSATVQVTVNAASQFSAGPDQSLTKGTTSTTLQGVLPGGGAGGTDSVILIVIMGDSNAGGNAPNTDLTTPQLAVRPVVQIFDGDVTGTFQNLHIGSNNQQSSFLPNTVHGLESSIANQVDSLHLTNPTYIVKIGVSGSYICQWLPRTGAACRPSGSLWTNWMPTVDLAIAQLTARGLKFKLVFWQSIGTNDRFIVHTNPDTFRNQMQEYRNAVRARYPTIPNIYFLSTNYNNPPTSTFDWAYIWPLMASDDPYFKEIPAYGTTYIGGGDITHWNDAGFQLLGKEMKDSTNKYYGADKVNWTQLSGTSTTIASRRTSATAVSGLADGNTYTYEFRDTVNSTIYKDTVSVSVQSASGGTQFQRIPATTFISSPGIGPEVWGERFPWNNSNSVQVPAGATGSKMWYSRFNWTDIESTTTQGTYSWTIFDSRINNAIDNGMEFSFGVMPMCSACGLPAFGYPTYLHNLMQAEPTNSKDWQNSGGDWVPNWNSTNFIGRYNALMSAIASHIATTSYKGRVYRDVIGYVDSRGAGDFGEWSELFASQAPTGRVATAASLMQIMDGTLQAFPNNQIIIPFGSFTSVFTNLPDQASYYALTATNAYGQMGWRRDNYGDDGYNDWVSTNSRSYNPGTGSVSFATLGQNKYKFAPVGGEPANDLNAVSRCGTPYCDLTNEVVTWNQTSLMGNGNYPTSASSTVLQTNYINALTKAGYRLVIDSFISNSTFTLGSNNLVTIYWKNIGIAPVYYNGWNVVIQLRNASNTTVYSKTSAFNPRLFLPAGSDSVVSDNLTISSGLPTGNYSIVVTIQDATGYRIPLPLGINGRQTDGSYIMKNVVLLASGGSNLAPIASAGPNQTKFVANSGSTTTANLDGTASSDADGTVASYAWVKLSGVSGGALSSTTSATPTVSNLSPGVYIYGLTVTDNLGAISSQATVTITINITPATPQGRLKYHINVNHP